jgi:hypothetical protein
MVIYTMNDGAPMKDQTNDSVIGEDAYERAYRLAVAMLDQGFHLGGLIRVTRDEWHER